MLAARYLCGVALLSSAVVFLSCNDSPTENEEQRIPAALDIVSGDGQEGTVDEELPDPLVVRVEDANGLPVIGQLVNFRVTSGGGTVFAGSGLTNASGVVQDRWTLGTSTAQDQRVEARAVDPNTGAAIVFATLTATPLPGPAHSVTKVAGDGQNGVLGAALPESLAVRVNDQYGNPVPGATVGWAASGGNGSVSPVTSQSNAEGIAKTRWTLGARLDVPLVVIATVGTPASAMFNVNAELPSTATIVKVAGDGASATVGAAMADSLAVRVQLASGEPVAGATVTWDVTGGGGSASPGTSVTQADGVARTRFTLGTVTGANVVTASVPGLATADITVAGAAGAPATVTKIGGDGQTGVVAEPLGAPLSIRVLDQYGNAVPNVTVTWTPSAGTATPAGASTDVNGEAAATWTLGQVVGNHTLSAAVGGLSAAQFTAVARAGAVTSLTVVDGGGQSATAGSALPTLVRAHATDSFGNSVSDASITFAASDGGAFSPSNATTDASGHAAAQWTLGPAAGTHTATISRGAVTATATATATSGAPTVLAIMSGNAQDGIAGDPLPQPLVVRVTDANANPVAGVAVGWNVGPSCGSVSAASSVTDAAGIAQTSWTLGTSGRACADGVTANASGASSVLFTARFLGRTPERIDAGNFIEQVATIDVPVVLVLVVTDAAENPVPGVTVTWTRTEGNGTPASSSGVTDSFGRASVVFTPGTIAGSNRVVASVVGVGNAEYHVWTRALAAERTVIVSGDGQSGEPGKKLAQPIVVRVEDKYGNGVYDAPVLFQVTAGGGHIERTTVRTEQSGRASAVWVPGSVGPQTATASAASGVTFTATGVEGSEEGLLIVGGNEQVFTVSFQIELFLAPMSVRVVNGRGDPVSGAPVVWNVDGGIRTVVSDAVGISTLTGARTHALGVGHRPITATLPNGTIATLYVVIQSSGGGAFGAPNHTGQASARVGRRLPGRVVVNCFDRMGAPASCGVGTHNATFTGSGGQIIPAPGLFPPGHYEYFWIMPDTPGTYYFSASAGGPSNNISATAVP